MSFFNQILLRLNLIHKKNLSKKHYFSFSGVDILIENIFRNQKNGFYIDVGCQHPIKNNNTYLLHKRGWSGINIDLDKDNIGLFNGSRISDDNINIAASNRINEVDLFFFHKKSPINTIDKRTSQFQKAKISSIKKIKTNTLNNIIKSSKYSNKKIDLLSIDVEGHELPVLEGLDFNKYRPNELNYDKTRVSFTKGCFRGQEIVARVHYLGVNRREFVTARVDINSQDN